MDLKDLDLERAVLGCCFLDNEVVHKVAIELTEEHFAYGQTRVVFQAIRHLFSESKNIDLVTIKNQLETMQMYEQIGFEWIKDTIGKVSTSAYIDTYIQGLKQLEHRRKSIKFAEKIIFTATYEESIDNLYKVVSDLPNFENTQFKHLTTDVILQNAVDNIAKRQQQKEVIPGLPTGFTDLDMVTGGMKNGEIIGVTAPPNVGKSILVQNIATNVAQKGKRVDLFSYEMTTKQLGDRLLPALSGVHPRVIQFPKKYMCDEDIEKIAEMENDILANNLHIYAEELNARTVAEIKAKVRETTIKTKKSPELIIVDYLQLLTGIGESWEVAGENVQGLKRLAREFDCPVIFISSLAKDGTIRGSGQIEFDSDQWWQIEREHDAEDYITRSSTKLVVKKNRDGGKGKIELAFMEKFLKFVSVEKA